MTSFKNKSLISWCLYDWANSVLATIIFTFIFPIYFSRNIVGNEELGSTYWGYVIGFSGLFIAIIGPILGSITDTYGPRKVIFGSLTFITIVATLALFWALPDSNFIFYALIFVAIATIGFELAQAQYNAMLPDIAPPKMIGKLSGISW
jgi:UMF1 family MFS transporter